MGKSIDGLNVGDEVISGGGTIAVITRRTTLKSGKFSKMVTLMYYDGSFRTVNVKHCRPILKHHYSVNDILTDLRFDEYLTRYPFNEGVNTGSS